MKLSRQLERHAAAFNKGLSFRNVLMEWAKEAYAMEQRLQRIEALFCCYDMDRICPECSGPIEAHRSQACTKCAMAETIQMETPSKTGLGIEPQSGTV